MAFNTLFQKQKKAAATIETSQHRQLYPVLPAEKILAATHRKELLSEIRLLSNAPAEQHQALYQKLIENYSEFTQLLPHTLIKRYQREGSILDYALERAKLAIEIRKEYKLPLGAAHATILQQHALWTYTIFSGSLLYNLGQYISQFRVHLFDEQKQFTQQWQPYTSSMLGQGQFYKFWAVSTADARQYKTATSLFARQIMPHDGFNWIASNPQIFNLWLALLNGDIDAAGILEIIFFRADKKILTAEELAEVVSYENILHAEAEEAAELDKEKDTTAGEAFLAWLVDSIEKKKLSINQKDSLVHIVDAGIFLLHPEIFKKFAFSNNSFRDWVVVNKQFNMLGFAKLSGNDYKFDQFFADTADKSATKSGMIIEDTRGLLFTQKMPAVNTNIKPVAYNLGAAYPKLTELPAASASTVSPTHK